MPFFPAVLLDLSIGKDESREAQNFFRAIALFPAYHYCSSSWESPIKIVTVHFENGSVRGNGTKEL